uniref:Uncharacterized protein n=1 Tax=Guillardia theta TaxID=55529 RepID=A0A7S4UEF6_GUITH|mmetsp:Transcript_906/g.2807  ORF Transcript_906/g.2807 Transcript_906/m.2807 type:complete len:111 (+) Transcript_906:301-633(+)
MRQTGVDLSTAFLETARILGQLERAIPIAIKSAFNVLVACFLDKAATIVTVALGALILRGEQIRQIAIRSATFVVQQCLAGMNAVNAHVDSGLHPCQAIRLIPGIEILSL